MLEFADTHPSPVAYIFSEESARYFDLLPSNVGRSSLVHGLVKALGLLSHMQYGPSQVDTIIRTIRVLEPQPCDMDLLEQYHSQDYLRIMLDPTAMRCSPSQEELDEFGLVDDCARFPGIQGYCRYLGGTVQATVSAIEAGSRYVINWDGGRHHAQSGSASGYCFINDAVLLILSLQSHHERILYVDLDLHHGDGVEKAFYYSNRVFTLSLHKHAPGFFPGTGSANDQGGGRGLGHCLNVPISTTISGAAYVKVFREAFGIALARSQASAIVCVCGADILSTDPHVGFNVGSVAYAQCIAAVLDCGIPTVFLGGGGYNHPDTAKCWASLTHAIISASNATQPTALPSSVPDHDFWPHYAANDNMLVEERPVFSEKSENDIVSKAMELLLRAVSSE